MHAPQTPEPISNPVPPVDPDDPTPDRPDPDFAHLALPRLTAVDDELAEVIPLFDGRRRPRPMSNSPQRGV